MAKIATATLEITTDQKGLITGLASADSALEGFSTRAIALGSAIGTVIGNLATDAVKRLGSALLELGTNGIVLASTVRSFESLSRAVGQSGEAMITAGRSGTKGLISDLELMGAANKGLLLGLPMTASSFGTLAQTAVVLGKAMGQGPVKSFDDLITALGRSSPMILDNLGLSVQVGAANEAYARSVGKTADQLTDAEKKLAFYNAAMDAAKRKVEEAGGLHLTLADNVQRVQASFKNFTDALGVAIATSPVLNAAVGGVADAITAAFGDNQTVLVQRLIRVVNTVALGIVDVAQAGITGASILHRAWAGVELLFQGLEFLIAGVAMGIGKIVEVAALLGSYVPGIGSSMRALYERTVDFNKVTGQSIETIKAQAASSWGAVKGQGAFEDALDTASGALTGLRARMEAAASTNVDAAAIAERLTQVHDDMGASATAAGEAGNRFASAWKSYTSTGRSFVETLTKMNGVTVEAIKWDLAHGKSKGDLAVIYGVTEDQIDAVGEALKFEATVAAAAAGIHATLATSVWNTAQALEQLQGRERTRIPTLTPGANAQLSALSNTFSHRLGAVLQTDLPKSIMAAIQGGGSIFEAAGSTLGAFLTSPNGLGKQIERGLTSLLGAGLGGAINALVPGLGALLGPLLSKMGGFFRQLFGGPSQQELQGRDIEHQFEAAFGGFDAMMARLGDDFVAAGRTRDEVQQWVKAMLDAEKQGPEAVQAWIDKIKQVQDEAARARAAVTAATQQAEADADAAAKARMSAAEKELQGLLDRRNELMKGIAAEAPEEVMGVIETQQRGQLQALDAQIQEKADAYAQLADETGQTMADAIVEALRNIHIEPVHVPVVLDRATGEYRYTDPTVRTGGDGSVPMKDGGYLRVSGPRKFLAGEAGAEDVVFGGAGRDLAFDVAAALANIPNIAGGLGRMVTPSLFRLAPA